MGRLAQVMGHTAPRATFRERHRQRRHQEFLDEALRIVAAEGLPALTMKRVTDELECASASIYSYFPSKGALIAAVQGSALQTLARSLELSQVNVEGAVAGRSEVVAALARVAAASRFWIEAESRFPREIELCRVLFGASTQVVPQEDGESVLSPALSLISVGSTLLEAAEAVGALNPGDAFERATVIVAGSTGLLQARTLARWDDRVSDSHRFADRMLEALLLGWGADPGALVEADAIVNELVASGALVPEVPETD